MAQFGLKQLDSVLTGSLQVSGSSGVTGSLDVDTNIVAGNRVTSDYGTINYSLTVNEAGHGGGDFRVEGTSDPYLIFADAGTDKLAIGTNVVSPSLLTVDGDITATHITASGNISASGTIYADNFTSTGGDVAGISFADDLNITGHITASGNLEIVGNALFGEYIYHKGDTDTFIRFEPDKIIIEAGGQNMIYMVQGSGGDQADKVTINNVLDDVDFQVKGQIEPNLIRADVANDRVGIGVRHPTANLHISGTLQVGSGSSVGHITASGDINTTSGRVYEAGTSVIDHATAMAIVFGG